MSFKSLFQQLVVFCGVGAVNTLFSLSIILALTEIARIHYLQANMIGYAAGIFLGFLLHRKITFRKYPSPSIIRQFQAFLTVFVIAYTVQFWVLYLIVDKMQVEATLAQIIAWAVFILISFTSNRTITFRKKTERKKRKQAGRKGINEFQDFRRKVSEKAEERGLTEKKLKKILATKD